VPAAAGFYSDFCFVDEHKKGVTRCLHRITPAFFVAGLFDGLDGDEPAGAAFVYKLDDAVDFRKERVVFADANVQAGLEFGSPLPDKDRTAGYQLSAKTLYAKPLRVAITAIA